ncbi:hypothetical protein MLD38_039725 [Melastoma candidum]|uniref:Uncharacterized protein n=1 Tax=Melastoma candidum TaxID=119954 RepID=A0ACB9L3W5_9MYRT|nr:hypothetical protein MLD38_039725 [Melastoma candidum]
MFYSQFILAKKGPLGTIWIAAHLERKLRKNQVADTDIGVSVDSIIFPEVPIALRLSSHLLLGVVRIYSRKVNYLFDDCSEALLKIKQAFRSTAVDLPPEESTAPYHSITLPETFDLDDFELPENEMFQGNYVDHHISAREQITLQDTMEGVVYSSQFGPDERFGDGGTCEINLDLDEEAFLQKVEETEHAESHNNFASPHPITPKEEEEDEFERNNILRSVLGDARNKQIEPTTVDSEPPEYAEAPATPGLVKEANLSSVKEALNSDNHFVASTTDEVMHAENNAVEMGILQTSGEGTSQPSMNEHMLENEAGKDVDNLQERDATFDSPDSALKPSNLESGTLDESMDCQNSNLHNVIQDDDNRRQDVLHAEATKEALGTNCISPDLDDIPRGEPFSSENKDDFPIPTGPSKDVKSTVTSDAPPTEIMLAAGDAADEVNTLLEDFTPGMEFLVDHRGNAKMTNISGKKRSLTESTLTEVSSEMSFSKRTLESVPDDDDLLSSILVGRRSSALKLRPSPAPSELPLSKRQRITQRVAANKRKVAVDDSMVLHGDAIREQLTNTEDLRRIRKKAPCTLPEISSIQRQFLGEEILTEPIITGFSLELHNLHKEAYDLSRTIVLEAITLAVGVDSVQEPIEIRPSSDTQFIEDGLVPELTETVSCSEPKQSEYLGLVPLVGIPGANCQEEHMDNVSERKLEAERVDAILQNDAPVSRPETYSFPSIVPEDAESYAGSSARKLDSVVRDGAGACINADQPKPTTSDAQCSENDSSKGGSMLGKGSADAEENVFRDNPRVESTDQMGEEVSVGGDGFRERYGATVETDCCFTANSMEGDLHNHGDQLLEQDIRELVYNQNPIEFQGGFGHSLVHNGHIGYEESTSCFDPQCSRDGEIPSVGNSAVDLYTDFEDAMAMNDTEFLNMDDDDDAADDGTIDANDPQLLENRVWSVRTRGVAKYLQTLFQKERLPEIQGRKVVAVDNLVAGKTRKEASRLFFESLVLKTRDYIQVEQRQPYDSIIVTPRSMLMKSEF